MKKRTLGADLTTSVIGLGCMGMSEFYGPSNDKESMRVLDRAVELGIDFFDTADMYGPHHNEELIGRFLKRSRCKVSVATKFGIVRNPSEYERSLDNSIDYMHKSCNASLRRLGVEQIDLYYVHRVDPKQPIEETMYGLSQLIKTGKIARVGLCEVNANTLRRAHAVCPITAVQSEYSLWSREVEQEVLPTCRELGIGFVPYSPLGRGFLTGRFQDRAEFSREDFRSHLPRFTETAIDSNRRIADVIAEMAQQKGCSCAQLSLAWLLSKGDDIVPIPGTKQRHYIEENALATEVTFTAEEQQQLETAIAHLQVVGERYAAEGMKGVNV